MLNTTYQSELSAKFTHTVIATPGIIYTQEDICSKNVLEEKFGSMSDEMYCAIMDTVYAEMQNLLDNGTIPELESFKKTIETNTQFFLKRYSHIN
jgi:hypothetical protein